MSRSRYAIRVAAVALVFVTSWALVTRARADGLTVFPGSLDFPDTFRGGEYYLPVGVVNNADVEATFRFQKQGDASDWLSLVDINDRKTAVESLVVPPHEQGQLMARMAVPAQTANGRYRGSMVVMRSLNGEGGSTRGTTGNASVSIGAQVNVLVVVSGTQRIEGKFEDLSIADTEVGLPLQAVSTIGNSGNVLVVPEISLSLVSGTAQVASKTFADEGVFPNEVRRIATQLDTSKLTPGDYVGRVKVSFGGKDFGGVERPFRLLPRGTLTRRGELDDLRLVNAPVAGSTAKVVARFRNTGEIDSKATFIGELTRNGTLVKAITGIERSVARGDESVLEVFVDIPQNGAYRLTGKVSFEGNETASRELAFQVGSGPPMYLVGGGALAAVVVVGGVLGIAWSRRRERNSIVARARGRAHGPMV